MKILTEFETLQMALKGYSLARYGDGELKICLPNERCNCISQVHDRALGQELREILAMSETDRPANFLPCIPKIDPKLRPHWKPYLDDKYFSMYAKDAVFGSSFITRPDSAPWIDTDNYWADVEKLWAGRDITLVMGTEKSLRGPMLASAKSIREVWGPRRDAYAEIDRIEEEIGTPSGPVLMCLGATATVLAYRLAKKGVHALDLGHIGMFARAAGAYRFAESDLISPEYKALLHAHRKTVKSWGGDGYKHADEVFTFAEQLNADSILDYGSGSESLCAALKAKGRRVMNYDPGIEGKSGIAKPCELVACTDVLEHVEEDKLDNVLRHIWCLAGKGAYLVISTRLAKAILPDGRNAHILVRPRDWWADKLKNIGWHIKFMSNDSESVVKFYLSKTLS